MMQSRIRKSRIEALLLEAIETDGFTVVYQPQIDLKTSEVYGYEALARIKEEDISPAEFITDGRNQRLHRENRQN